MGLDRAVTEVFDGCVVTPELGEENANPVLGGHLRFHRVLPTGEGGAEFVGDSDDFAGLKHPLRDAEDSHIVRPEEERGVRWEVRQGELGDGGGDGVFGVAHRKEHIRNPPVVNVFFV